MNLVRSHLSVRNLLGQRIRGMCSNKLQETKAESSPAASAQEPHPLFKVSHYRPSQIDKKILIWAGRFKSVDQIPEFVPSQMLDSARNKLRIKVAYVMMALTLVGCVLMVIMGKKAAGRNESLAMYNMEKKAKWKEEYEKEKKAQ